MIPKKKKVDYQSMIEIIKSKKTLNMFYDNEIITTMFNFTLSDIVNREVRYNHCIRIKLPDSFNMYTRNNYIYFKNQDITIACEVDV